MPIFAASEDCEQFLTLTREITAEDGVNVHGFVVMTTHFHLVVTPTIENGLSRAMQRIEGRFTSYYNRQYGRIGTSWNGRFRGLPIEDERYWLQCLVYVEQNPVRAHMVTDPADYKWSSYRVHAFGEETDWLVPHDLYQRLGASPAERQAAYRAFCGVGLNDTELALQRRLPKKPRKKPTG